MRHLALCLLLVSVAFGALFVSLDPLAEYRNADGSLTLPGEVLQALVTPQSPTRTVFVPNFSGPTLAWKALEVPNERFVVRSIPQSTGGKPSPELESLKAVFDGIVQFWAFNWLIGGAAATTTDTHFLVSDAACTTTLIATDGDCWSHTSSGAGIGSGGVPGSGNAVRLDAGSGAGSFTVDAAMSAASWVQTGFTGTINMGSFTLTVSGDMNISAGTFNRNTSTVVFAANGTLTMTANNIDRSLYNMTINAGITVTNATNSSWVSNLLTVNGTLVAASPSPAQRIINVSGEVATTPVVIGSAGDVDSSGYFIYRLRGPCGTTYTITSGTYQHVTILAGNSTCAYTANLGGTITTTSCGIFRDCAILASSEATLTPAAQFTFNTQNFTMTIGGIFWMGDGTTTGGTFNLGSSVVTSEGFAPTGNNVVVNVNTARVTSGPQTGTSDGFSADEPLCFSGSGTVTVNFNSSIFTCDGQFRLFGSGTFNLGSSTITVTDNRGCQNCAGVGYPGEFNMVANITVNMGSATITVEDRWTNNAANVATYDRGTSTVRLYWDFSNTAGTETVFSYGAGHYFVGPTNLAEAEFYSLEIRGVGTGARSVVSINDSSPWGPVWVESALTIRDVDGGTTNLNMQNFNITTGRVTIEPNTTLTMGTASLVDISTFENRGTMSMDSVSVTGSLTPIIVRVGGSDSIDISAWTAWSVLGGVISDVRWSFDSSTSATAGVSIQVDNLPGGYRYILTRGGADLDTDQDRDTSAELSSGSGWTSGPWSMSIVAVLVPVEGPEPRPMIPLPVVLVVFLGAAWMVYYAHLRRKHRRKP